LKGVDQLLDFFQPDADPHLLGLGAVGAQVGCVGRVGAADCVVEGEG
jgi:hypothetical protein